jgi:hypothetical protein
VVGHHPHVLQPIETYHTQDGRNTVIFYSLGNFLSNQSRTYIEGLMPESNGDPRDSMIGEFSAVRRDYGPAGVRVELGHVGILPAWGENNRNEIATGRTKTPIIRPILIDREVPQLEAAIDELTGKAGKYPVSSGSASASQPVEAPPPKTDANAGAAGLTPEQKKQFIELTTRLKLLTDRRAQILARTGDEYVTAPPKPPAKP